MFLEYRRTLLAVGVEWEGSTENDIVIIYNKQNLKTWSYEREIVLNMLILLRTWSVAYWRRTTRVIQRVKIK